MTVALMPSPTVEVLEYVGVPRAQVHGQLGRLVVLLAQRYGLDPALRHVEVIPAKGGLSVYITADGWRFLANRSGLLDGLTFRHVERGEHGWRATARVWKKGCTHPFDGLAGCGFAEGKDDPEAIAITRATRRALRNAFADAIRIDTDGVTLFDDDDDGGHAVDDPEPVAVQQAPAARAAVGSGVTLTQSDAHRAVGAWSEIERQEFAARHSIDLRAPFPPDALAEVAAGLDPGEVTEPGSESS